MLTKKAINEFKQIYLEEYGKRITDQQAVEMGINLINALKIVLKPESILDIYGERSKNEN